MEISDDRVDRSPKISKREVRLMRSDVAIGMALSQLVMWSIITTTGGSLHANGLTDIQSSDQAAKALQPLVKSFPYAGEISKAIFAVGVMVPDYWRYPYWLEHPVMRYLMHSDGRKD